MKFEISRHARYEMKRRGISEDLVQAVLQNPGILLMNMEI